MINFRYHVVSLTAVFLALAIGLVVGTAAANGPVTDGLSNQVTAAHKANSLLRDQLTEANDELAKQEQYWASAAAQMLPGKLDGKRILVVTMRSSAKYVDNLDQLLAKAGAKISNRLILDDNFTDPTKNAELLDIANTAAPAGVKGALPNRSNGVETSTSLLAALLMANAPVEGAKTAISAYQSQGYLELSGDPTPAEAVVFLAANPYSEADAAKRNAAVQTIVERFDQAGKLVLGAPSAAGDGNVVRTVRDDPDLVKQISTVDNASTVLGRLATVLALVEQTSGKTGHYGRGTGATGIMPVPAGTTNGS